ncbi:MAG: DUF1638 domain-containing protein [Candidatus Puniceispirillum sp.]|nr:DUF1638 domain-containing protein [Candidatus Puniceispirillum sp.]MBL6773833.1 DUF1638 domain-containing protein [Candidatus Puniceispirillum sp.]
MNKQQAKAVKPAHLHLIACGALARELLVLINQLPEGAVELTCLPASWHNHPEKIVPGLKKKIAAARRDGMEIAVAYGDCGTGGEIDALLEAENIARIAGPHCYEMFLGKPDFDAEMDKALGTFFLTDYMVRHFERIVMKGMALRQYPQLRDLYFAHYTRVLYIAQTRSKTLQEKAQKAACELGLDYEYRYTGYGEFSRFLKQFA